ncbi:MAG: rhodanese-related sulfurtransferase [Rhabdochlamydiaceae bacterium]
MDNQYLVLAYYHFVAIPNPEQEVRAHKEFLKGKNIKCRIYLCKDGINGQTSGSFQDAQLYMEWLKQNPLFKDVKFKVHFYHENVFPRATVKLRPQLAALDVSFNIEQTGEHVSPKKWKEMLASKDEDTILIDVRNNYEWEIGHFEGAELPNLEKFRDFPAYANNLKQTKDVEKTKVLMYCTGGIRCEIYSAFLKEKGFEHVYQLDGGVIQYGLDEGNAHWKGKLFVFDDRMSVPIANDGESEIISSCSHCSNPSDIYYNCAHMDCNHLFLSCPDCADKMKGCCSQACLDVPPDRLRLYVKTDRPKPFRRLSQTMTECGCGG